MLLEKIQLEAVRIVTGTTKLVGIDKSYKELGWLKLSERRRLHILFLYFKMEKGLTPLYLTHLIPLRVGDTTNYPLRNSDDYVAINANIRSYANSFLPSTIIAWNNLPNSVKSATTIASFKHMLAQSNPIIPDYYYNGERKFGNPTHASSNWMQLLKWTLIPSKSSPVSKTAFVGK